MATPSFFQSLQANVSQAASVLNLDNLRAANVGDQAAADTDLQPPQATSKSSTNSHHAHEPATSSGRETIDELRAFDEGEPAAASKPSQVVSSQLPAATPPRQPRRAGGVFDALASGGRYLEQGVAAAHSALSPGQAAPRTPAPPQGAQLPGADAKWAHNVGVGGPSVLAGALHSAAAPSATGGPDFLASHASAPAERGLDEAAGSTAPYLTSRPLAQASNWLSHAAGSLKGAASKGLSLFSVHQAAHPDGSPAPDAVFTGASITASAAQQPNSPPESLIGACMWISAPLAAVAAGKCAACVAACTSDGGTCNCRAAHVTVWVLQAMWRVMIVAFGLLWRLLHLMWSCCLPQPCRAVAAGACKRVHSACMGVTVRQGAVVAAASILLLLAWAYRADFALGKKVAAGQEEHAHVR